MYWLAWSVLARLVQKDGGGSSSRSKFKLSHPFLDSINLIKSCASIINSDKHRLWIPSVYCFPNARILYFNIIKLKIFNFILSARVSSNVSRQCFSQYVDQHSDHWSDISTTSNAFSTVLSSILDSISTTILSKHSTSMLTAICFNWHRHISSHSRHTSFFGNSAFYFNLKAFYSHSIWLALTHTILHFWH